MTVKALCEMKMVLAGTLSLYMVSTREDHYLKPGSLSLTPFSGNDKSHQDLLFMEIPLKCFSK